MKKTIMLILSLLIALSFCGCDEITEALSTSYIFKSNEEILILEEDIIHIGYKKETKNEDFDEFITLDELKAWENICAKYRTSVLYDKLNESEQIIYLALEYAMAHSYRTTYIDSQIYSNPNVGEKVLHCLALESPLLEQNLVFMCGNPAACFYSVEIPFRDTIEAIVRCGWIDVANFKEGLWDNKLLAIEEAEKVYAQMDKSGTREQLLRRIYTYVAEGITYDDYDVNGLFTAENIANFLYDGVVNKKTQCDGITNTLALYLVLAGFKQVEKEDAYELGHTWNCIELDNKWYNIDATWNRFIPKNDSSMGAGLYYCFSDKLQACGTDRSELYPKCETSLFMEPDAILENYSSSQLYSAMEKSYKKHNKKWALLIVDKVNTSTIAYQLGKLCYYYNDNLYFHYGEVIGDKYYVLICKNKYFKDLT